MVASGGLNHDDDDDDGGVGSRDHSQAFIVCHNLTICCHGDLWLQLIHTDLWESKQNKKVNSVNVNTCHKLLDIKCLHTVCICCRLIYNHVQEPLLKDLKLFHL